MSNEMKSKLQLKFNLAGPDEKAKVKAVTFSYINHEANDEDLQAVAESLGSLYAYPLTAALRHNTIILK